MIRNGLKDEKSKMFSSIIVMKKGFSFVTGTKIGYYVSCITHAESHNL